MPPINLQKCTINVVYLIQTPHNLLTDSIKSLASYLTEDSDSEVGKVRAIFKFIAAQKMEEFNDRDARDGTAYKYLAEINKNMKQRDDLFVDLCRYGTRACNGLKLQIHFPRSFTALFDHW